MRRFIIALLAATAAFGAPIPTTTRSTPELSGSNSALTKAINEVQLRSNLELSDVLNKKESAPISKRGTATLALAGYPDLPGLLASLNAAIKYTGMSTNAPLQRLKYILLQIIIKVISDPSAPDLPLPPVNGVTGSNGLLRALDTVADRSADSMLLAQVLRMISNAIKTV